LRDSATNIGRISVTPNVWRLRRTTLGFQYFFDRCEHRVMRIFVTQKLEHHGATPDLTNWIRDAFARNVWGRTMNWFKQGRELAIGI
jgi:hypothetical protein